MDPAAFVLDVMLFGAGRPEAGLGAAPQAAGAEGSGPAAATQDTPAHTTDLRAAPGAAKLQGA
ncbi:MAG: hypothetical protein QNJ16_09570 [Rhodobacter sp.]|nr:hypothetical protein [Rhodobacter sp.]